MAQGAESGYDPCAGQAAALPTICTTNHRTCGEGSFHCSEGYCFTTPPIPPNAGIPAGGVVIGKNIEINGNYQITQTATFTNCNFKMHPASLITLAPVTTGKAIITFENCQFFSCDSLWKGIITDATSAGKLILHFTGCIVEDAYTGLTLDEGPGLSFAPAYDISGCTFFNNYIGISNRRQNNQILNAVITGNQFYTTATLRPVPGSMLSLPLSDYPNGHAGIEYTNTTTDVGVTTGASIAHNFFSCLVHGIIANSCTLASYFNDFFDMHSAGYGIEAIDGEILVDANTFVNGGYYGIYLDGVTVRGITRNSFSGTMRHGVYSLNNLNGEYVRITNNNSFQINTNTWISGVYLERSQASSLVHNLISGNTFTVSNYYAGGVQLIAYRDFATATDECRIEDNFFFVQSSVGIGIKDCIDVLLGNSSNLKIENNAISSLTTSNPGMTYGIFFNPGVGYTGTSTGHLVKHNSVIGTGSINSITCAYHHYLILGLELCDNTADYSGYGFHFIDENDIAFKENKMNHHGYCLSIEQFSSSASPEIGIQDGRGNTWSTIPNDCIAWAAQNYNTINPFTSRFLVPESTTLPFLPPSSKIDPDPTVFLQDWFKNDPTVPLDYCQEDVKELILSPFETLITEDGAVQTGAHLWDLERRIYTKLLLHPELRPTGSPEEAFFNDLAQSPIAGFANIAQALSLGLALDVENETLLEAADSASILNWSAISTADAAIDFSTFPDLDDEWYDARATALQSIQTAGNIVFSVESGQAEQITETLNEAIVANDAIAVSAPCESACASVNDFTLQKMAREPLTQERYEALLSLAQQDPETAGQSILEARISLAPCDAMELEHNMPEDREGRQEKEWSLPQTGEVLIVPNPASEFARVSLPPGAHGLLCIYDNTGRRIKEVLVNPDSHMPFLNLRGWHRGIFWVVFIDATDGKSISARLIHQQ